MRGRMPSAPLRLDLAGGLFRLFAHLPRAQLDAADLDAFLWFAALAAGAEVALEARDLVEHLEAGFDLAEDRVLAVEELRVLAVHDEELRTRGVRIARPGHRHDAPRVRDVVELGRQLIAGATGARLARSTLLRVRTPGLDHEVAHDPVERDAVVETLLRELQEAVHVLSCLLGEERDDHRALVGHESSFDGRGVDLFEVHCVVVYGPRKPEAAEGSVERERGNTRLLLHGQQDRGMQDHGLDGPAPFRGRPTDLRRRDPFESVHALFEVAERRVLAVEARVVLVHDEEAGTRGVGLVRAGRRQRAAQVAQVARLEVQRVARAAAAPELRLAVVLRVRAATLDHEVAQDA